MPTPASEPSRGAPLAEDELAPGSCALGTAWISEFDLSTLLSDLGLNCLGGDDGDQEAVLAAEQEALATYDATIVDITGRIAEYLPAGPALAAVLAQRGPAGVSDLELPGIAASYRRLAGWAQAGELAAVAEIAARSAAGNPKIGTDDYGRPRQLPPEAAAQVALAMQMSQPGASDWVNLAMEMRWRLPSTGAALSAGAIDMARARIIADGTSVLPDELASAVEERVLPSAADQTTGQLRGAVCRAVIAIDPKGAEERRKDTERRAKVALYPDDQGTATLTGSCLPGVHAAAAMARISAMARALKASGAHGGLDLLRAHIYLGLLLGTIPTIPPPADGPLDEPPADDPPDEPGPDGLPHEPAANGSLDGLPTDDGHNDAPAANDRSGRLPADDCADQPPNGDSPENLPAAGPRISPAGGPDHPVSADRRDTADSARPATRQRRDCPAGDDCPPTAWQDIPPPTDEDAPTDADWDPGDMAIEFPTSEDTEEDGRAELPAPDWPTLPARLPGAGTAAPSQAGSARPPVGLLDVVIPWSALTGDTTQPGLLSWIGPVDGLQARQLFFLAACSAETQWQVVVTDEEGRALAVERARLGSSSRARQDRGGTIGVVGRITVTIRASCLSSALTSGRSEYYASASGTDCARRVAGIVRAILRACARAAGRAQAEREASGDAGACSHITASAAYRPPPRIREHVAARDITCRFLTCGQPAWRTDLDHTVPWHKGGPTCACNLGGCCRTHHKIKQLPGWQLAQPQPGMFRWTTPAGRSYLVKRDVYPV